MRELKRNKRFGLLSYREVQELLAERGINVNYSTIWRWVQRYAPELAPRHRAHLKPTNKSWRVDETYVRVKGEWCYLYRAVDSGGATVEFFLSAFRDKDAAQSLFRRAIRHGAPPPRVINTDLAPTYPTAIAGLQRSGDLSRRCGGYRPVTLYATTAISTGSSVSFADQSYSGSRSCGRTLTPPQESLQHNRITDGRARS